MPRSSAARLLALLPPGVGHACCLPCAPSCPSPSTSGSSGSAVPMSKQLQEGAQYSSRDVDRRTRRWPASSFRLGASPPLPNQARHSAAPTAPASILEPLFAFKRTGQYTLHVSRHGAKPAAAVTPSPSRSPPTASAAGRLRAAPAGPRLRTQRCTWCIRRLRLQKGEGKAMGGCWWVGEAKWRAPAGTHSNVSTHWCACCCHCCTRGSGQGTEDGGGGWQLAVGSWPNK